MSEARLAWGHAILTPDGQEIRIPGEAFAKLRRLGCLLPNRNHGLLQISSSIYEFLDPECETLSDGLRRLLGVDISGPLIVDCHCPVCVNQAKRFVAERFGYQRALEFSRDIAPCRVDSRAAQIKPLR